MVSNAETEIHRDDKHPFPCEDDSSPVNTRTTTCSDVAFRGSCAVVPLHKNTFARSSLQCSCYPRNATTGACSGLSGSFTKAETTKERETFCIRTPERGTSEGGRAIHGMRQHEHVVNYPMHNRHVICIPKVSNKITKQYIFGIFCALKIGYIEKLTEVPIKTDQTHKRIFVKVKWNQSELAKYIYNRFENGENVKVVYSEPWYWICVSNMASTTARTYHGHE